MNGVLHVTVEKLNNASALGLKNPAANFYEDTTSQKFESDLSLFVNLSRSLLALFAFLDVATGIDFPISNLIWDYDSTIK